MKAIVNKYKYSEYATPIVLIIGISIFFGGNIINALLFFNGIIDDATAVHWAYITIMIFAIVPSIAAMVLITLELMSEK